MVEPLYTKKIRIPLGSIRPPPADNILRGRSKALNHRLVCPSYAPPSLLVRSFTQWFTPLSTLWLSVILSRFFSLDFPCLPAAEKAEVRRLAGLKKAQWLASSSQLNRVPPDVRVFFFFCRGFRKGEIKWREP